MHIKIVKRLFFIGILDHMNQRPFEADKKMEWNKLNLVVIWL